MDEQNPLAVLNQLSDDNTLPTYPQSKLLVFEDKVIFETFPEYKQKSERVEIPYDQIDEVVTHFDILGDTGDIEIKTLDKRSFKLECGEEKKMYKIDKFISRKISPLQFSRKVDMLPVRYHLHHITINAKDLFASESFYYLLGFKKAFEYKARDGSLAVLHLKNGNNLLEIFSYSSETPNTPKDEQLYFLSDGVKHFALNVPSLGKAKDDLLKKGIKPHSDISEGRMGIKHFLIKDPDGIFVEIVQDDRELEVY